MNTETWPEQLLRLKEMATPPSGCTIGLSPCESQALSAALRRLEDLEALVEEEYRLLKLAYQRTDLQLSHGIWQGGEEGLRLARQWSKEVHTLLDSPLPSSLQQRTSSHQEITDGKGAFGGFLGKCSDS